MIGMLSSQRASEYPHNKVQILDNFIYLCYLTLTITLYLYRVWVTKETYFLSIATKVKSITSQCHWCRYISIWMTSWNFESYKFSTQSLFLKKIIKLHPKSNQICVIRITCVSRCVSLLQASLWRHPFFRLRTLRYILPLQN